MNKQPKFIFVTGGVVSSLGKGISAASIGRLLKRRGLNIFSMKLDPYLNYDPSKMSPTQHGEVFVTKDGADTDLDLGHYERIINTSLTKESSVTSGKIYQAVLDKERRGEYHGATIQIIPHITNEIKDRLFNAFNAKGDTDVCIVEIGGTVGDIESLPYFEAIRQLRRELGYENTFFMHNTLVPYLETSGEIKTKPTQHSVKELTSLGIQPDAILLRSRRNIGEQEKKKVALFCNVNDKSVISVKDVNIIYEVSLNLQKQHLDDLIVNHLHLECNPKADMSDWVELISKIKAIKKETKIAIVGKYVELHDAYLSIVESLKFAGYNFDTNISLKWIDSRDLEKEDANLDEIFLDQQGIIVGDGNDEIGNSGDMKACEYARTHNIPFLGLGLGMHLALIEFARDVLNLQGANSIEFESSPNYKVITYISDDKSMRRGDQEIKVLKDTLAHEIYENEVILERHRDMYCFNNEFKKIFEENGVIFSGVSAKEAIAEIFELKNHPFFIGVQYHPEFLSRPTNAHPLFKAFLKACLEK